MSIKKVLQYLAILIGLSILYFSSAQLGLLFSFQQTNATPIWPPSGLAFAAILLLGARVWPGIFLGAIWINTTIFLGQHLEMGPALFFATGISIGNTLEAVVGAWILKKFFQTSQLLDRPEHIIQFSIAASLSCLIASLVGTAIVCKAGTAPWVLFKHIWSNWWLGDVTSILTLTPVWVMWRYYPSIRWTGLLKLGEELFMLFGLFVIYQIVFGQALSNNPFHNRSFVFILILLWASIRFDPFKMTFFLFVTTILITWGTTKNASSLSLALLNKELLFTQAFLSTIALSFLSLSASLSWRGKEAEDIRQRLAEIVETASDIISIIGIDQKILYMNPAGRRALKIPLKGDISQTFANWYYPHWVRALMEAKGIAHTTQKDIWSGETTLLSQDGKEIPIWQIIITHRDENEKPTFFSTIARDLSEKKESESILRESKKKLSEAQKLSMVGQLASGVAHEINNPLQAIRGNLETMTLFLKEKGITDTEISEIISDTELAAHRCQQIVKDLLDLARPTTKKEWEKVRIEEALHEALMLTGTELNKEHVQIEQNISFPLPPVNGHHRELMQVFVNLILNATVAMTHADEKCLRISAFEEKGKLVIRFEDTGHGIGPDVLPHIFEPFFTTAYDDVSKNKGRGLGLSVCQRIIQSHHGEIKAEAQPDKGALFTVTLPI
ncbi:MAG: MASE1 domain-containing protein [Deltaproteobacteria bacterium]|nr:MASE1 domain-containing protein [Deltaproteobacteria bacterium]